MNLSTKKSHVNQGLAWRLQSGFTLIELLVVVAILGVLASISIAAINPLGQIAKAHDAQRKSDLGQIQKALEQYYQDNGRYPATQLGAYYMADATDNSIKFKWGDPWTINNVVYMSKVPKDPLSSYTYLYFTTDGQQYWLYARLENTTDPQGCKVSPTTGTCENQPTPWACDTGNNFGCNYGVSSSNVSP